MALRALKRSYEELVEKEKTLSDILSALRAGYNPNYQDMAVLEAVRGYEFYAGLPASNDRDRAKEDEAGSEVSKDDSGSKGEEPLVEYDDEWSKDQLEKDLTDLLDTDIESLLLEHDQHARNDAESLREFAYTNNSLLLTCSTFSLRFIFIYT